MPTTEREFSDEVRKEALEWQVLIENDDLDPAERIALDAWLQADPRHAQALDRAQTVLSAFETLDERVIKPAYTQQSPLDWVRHFIADLTDQPSTIKTGASFAAGCAAMLAVGFLVVGPFFGPQPSEIATLPAVVTVHETGLGEMETIRLADESVLTLGPATRIEVAFSDSARSVTLSQGAAVFDVTSDADRPFTVKADGFSARVLGTVFDVRSNGGVVRLSVSEGVVEASHPFVINNAPSSIVSRRTLTAGEAISATPCDGLSRKRAFTAETFAAWRENRLRYNGATLSELVADANRYSSQPILIDAAGSEIGQLKATFTYDARDLETMLTALPNLFPVQVDRSSENAITIRPVNDG